MLKPNYTAVEYERRFLVTAAPQLHGPAIQITDRHLTGTRVYLRKAIHTDGNTALRLCKQYAAGASGCAAIAVEELTPHDFVLYEHMEANVITKRRWHVETGGAAVAIDVFSGPLQGLVLCEVAAAVEAEIAAFEAPGPLVARTTPALPVSLPHASAIKAAPPSWRQVITLILVSCKASRISR